MTSPSETIDLDTLEVPYIAIRDDGSTTLTYATKEGARETIPLPPQVSQVLRGVQQSLSEAYATIDRLESRPRTVGDLTARDLGRRVRIEFTEFTLDAMEYAGSLTGMSEPIDLDAIRARADATLPGPWTWREFPAGYEFVTPDNEAIRWPDEETAFEFAAHAREDVPVLLAEVERLRVELAKSRAAYAYAWRVPPVSSITIKADA